MKCNKAGAYKKEKCMRDLEMLISKYFAFDEFNDNLIKIECLFYHKI